MSQKLLLHGLSKLHLTIEDYTVNTHKEDGDYKGEEEEGEEERSCNNKSCSISAMIVKNDGYWKSISSLQYRITRKAIVASFLKKCNVIKQYLESSLCLQLPDTNPEFLDSVRRMRCFLNFYYLSLAFCQSYVINIFDV